MNTANLFYVWRQDGATTVELDGFTSTAGGADANALRTVRMLLTNYPENVTCAVVETESGHLLVYPVDDKRAEYDPRDGQP